jgi:hypothetical protein
MKRKKDDSIERIVLVLIMVSLFVAGFFFGGSHMAKLFDNKPKVDIEFQ